MPFQVNAVLLPKAAPGRKHCSAMGAFRFKQFEVVQEHSAMKVNTDAVLLGAWMSVGGAAGDGNDAAGIPLRALDIGTGTGVIALMAGQRLAQAGLAAHIDAVEIDEGACKDAAANFAAAPWEGITFHLHRKSLQEFAGEMVTDSAAKFNLIVSNPPYFISSLKNDSAAKTMARHTDTLSQRELLFHSIALLAEGGIFAVILPVAEGEELLRKVEFMAQAAVNHCKAATIHCEATVNKEAGDTQNTRNTGDTSQLALFPSRVCYVHTTERKPAKRLMLEFVKCHPTARPALQREQLVMMSGGSYTPEYTSLVGDFYLWG